MLPILLPTECKFFGGVALSSQAVRFSINYDFTNVLTKQRMVNIVLYTYGKKHTNALFQQAGVSDCLR